mgnify:CR=1 FL=1
MVDLIQLLSTLAVLISTIAASSCDLNLDAADWYGPQKMPPSYAMNDVLPKNFDWGNVDGKNYLTRVKNQKIPLYCGSCWALAITSGISDRIKIMRKGAFPEISLAAQILLNCNRANFGCNGGVKTWAFDWIRANYLTDESCSPYMARSYRDGLNCDEMTYCKECSSNGTCWVPKKYNKYTISDYGLIKEDDIETMMKEIFNNGPLTCSVNQKAIDAEYKGGSGVFGSKDKGPITHAITIVGWGETDEGTPYWIMKNSFGEDWGDRGFIKIYRGNNTVRIEERCAWALPKNTWSDQVYPHKDFANAVEESTEVAPTQQALPQNFFFGDVAGVDYLSQVVNQHLPNYCGSCWAQATASSLADRINYLITKNKPRVLLSVQVILNCEGGGTCKGGDQDKALDWIKKNGVPEVGCQQYDAFDPPADDKCSSIQQCMYCTWIGDHVTTCYPIPHKRWYVSEFAKVEGVQKIKEELVNRGPLVCSMIVTPKFREYTGGIYSEVTDDKVECNHEVSIVGYGIDKPSGREYWIARNSWGTQFGENGYFRLPIGNDNLKIESNCWYGVPTDKAPQSLNAATE